MRTTLLLFLAALLLFNFQEVNAQEEGVELDTTNYYRSTLPEQFRPDPLKYKKRKLDDLERYNNLETPYAPKQRHWGTLSVAGGFMATNGDIKSRLGWNVGLRYRWNLGYLVSMRVDFRHGRSYGQNVENKSLVGSLEENQLTQIHNDAYNGSNGSLNYANFNQYTAFDNYKNEITDASVSVLFHLNNIKFHRKNSIVNAYVFAGMGGMLFKTWVDAQDNNGNAYNYQSFIAGSVNGEFNQELADVFVDGFVSGSEKGTVREALDILYSGDRSYETLAEGQNDGGFLDRKFRPTFHVGAAIDFLVHPRITVGIETKHSFTNDDLLDGQRWSEQGDLTRDYDTYNQTTLTLGYNIGKRKEKSNKPMWWENPNQRTAYLAQQQLDAQKIVDAVEIKDADGDGVPDEIDEDDNTPAGVAVNRKGETLDSDGDGCPDHEDPEPFSTPVLPIKDCKNVYDFANSECCDEKATVIATVPCREIELPSIHFDDDKYYVKPEFYAHLHEVAKKMQDCPDLKVVADGHTDTKDDVKYNEQLSWNRVNASINYLVEKYGISRDRFIVNFSGERTPLTGDESAFQKYQNRRVEFRFAEDGESGVSNPPAPHPGIKAGSDK